MVVPSASKTTSRSLLLYTVHDRTKLMAAHCIDFWFTLKNAFAGSSLRPFSSRQCSSSPISSCIRLWIEHRKCVPSVRFKMWSIRTIKQRSDFCRVSVHTSLFFKCISVNSPSKDKWNDSCKPLSARDTPTRAVDQKLLQVNSALEFLGFLPFAGCQSINYGGACPSFCHQNETYCIYR